MLDDFDGTQDSAYTLSLSPTDRPGAATDISIRVDDGADLVLEMANRTGRIQAYLTVDQAEDVIAALKEILGIPSDRTGSIDVTGVVRRSLDLPSVK